MCQPYPFFRLMQLARCVWRKRRFLFTRLTMVLAKGSRCTFFSYFVPGSVLRTRSQLVIPIPVFSSVHESTGWATLRVGTFHLLREKMFQFFCFFCFFIFSVFVCVYVRRLKARRVYSQLIHPMVTIFIK